MAVRAYIEKPERRKAVKKYRASEKGKRTGRLYKHTDKAKNTLKNRIRSIEQIKQRYFNAIAKVAYYKTCIAISRIQNIPDAERHEIDTTNL